MINFVDLLYPDPDKGRRLVNCVRFFSLEILPRLFYRSIVKIVPAAKFKEQCMALLDRVDQDGILITKHGKPVAKLVPVHTDNA